MIIRLKSVFQMLTSLIEQFIVSFIWLKLTTDVHDMIIIFSRETENNL